jgi:hypothetical protein
MPEGLCRITPAGPAPQVRRVGSPFGWRHLAGSMAQSQP